MGVLADLSDVQETYKGILQQLRREADKSFEQAIAANSGSIDDDALVAIAVSLFEIESREEGGRSPREHDLLWAIDVIDQLDTQGFEVVRKQ